MCLFDLSTLEEDEAALSVKNSESSVVGMTCYYIHVLLCPMVQVVIQQGVQYPQPWACSHWFNASHRDICTPHCITYT